MSLLDKIKLPGRIFQLPSKGLFYEKGVLSESATNSGEVEVKTLSGLMEIKLRNADLLYSGRILSDLCVECIPDILKPNELCIKDVDALFLFLGISTNGSEMNIQSIHDCEKAKLHSYMINLEQISSKPNNEILSGSTDILFSVKLDNGQEVKMKPLSFGDQTRIFHLLQDQKLAKDKNDSDLFNKLNGDILTFDVLSRIKSVDGVTDKNEIFAWIESIPSKYIKQMNSQYEEAMKFGFNLNHELICKDCGSTYNHNLELNQISFLLG